MSAKCRLSAMNTVWICAKFSASSPLLGQNYYGRRFCGAASQPVQWVKGAKPHWEKNITQSFRSGVNFATWLPQLTTESMVSAVRGVGGDTLWYRAFVLENSRAWMEFKLKWMGSTVNNILSWKMHKGSNERFVLRHCSSQCVWTSEKSFWILLEILNSKKNCVTC